MDPANGIEQMCFKSIKYSLEMAVIPIRKFLIIFYVFLRLQFGSAPSKQIWLITLYRVPRRVEGHEIPKGAPYPSS